MNWTTIAPIIPICPGDVVWGPSPEGLKRQATRGVRGEYIALDDAETCAAFDKRLGERLGVGANVEVVKTSKGWSVIGERVVTLDHGTDDPLVARVLLWAKGPAKEAPPATVSEVKVEVVVVAEPEVSAPVASEAAPTPSAPAPTKARRSPR